MQTVLLYGFAFMSPQLAIVSPVYTIIKGTMFVDLSAINSLSLCTGVGGLDLGLKLGCRAIRTVCYVEIEAYACEVLARRMQEKALDDAPIWTDLKTFDGKPWRGAVDLVTGGYPCQPFSVAGNKRGAEDPRHLWPYIRRIVSEIEPAFCFFENVAGHLRLGFEEVANDLQGMGYKVKAGLFTAAEVGSTHKRERLFILAYRDDQRWRWRGRIGNMECPQRSNGCQGHQSAQASAGCHPTVLADSRGCGCDGRRNNFPERCVCEDQIGDVAAIPEDGSQFEYRISEDRETVANGSILGLEVGRTDCGACRLHGNGIGNGQEKPEDGKCVHIGACKKSEHVADGHCVICDRPFSTGSSRRQSKEAAAGRSDDMADTQRIGCRRWGDGNQGRCKCAPETAGSFGACYEEYEIPLWPPAPNDADGWQNVPAHLEPAVLRMADGLANRVDEIRACGNGVVPLVAAYAWRTLTADILF